VARIVDAAAKEAARSLDAELQDVSTRQRDLEGLLLEAVRALKTRQAELDAGATAASGLARRLKVRPEQPPCVTNGPAFRLQNQPGMSLRHHRAPLGRWLGAAGTFEVRCSRRLP